MLKRWGDIFSGVGTITLSLLSCVGCPMCLPLYAGFLSLIGVELIDLHTLFFPITLGFGLLTLGFMAYQIHTHHGSWNVFMLAIVAMGGMSLCAFFGYDYVLYAFLAAFMACIVWNKKRLVHEGRQCC
jgi:uncharacterized membrane protein